MILISASLQTLEYMPFIILAFNGNLTLPVAVTPVGPYSRVQFCWGLLNLGLLCPPDDCLPVSAMLLASSS